MNLPAFCVAYKQQKELLLLLFFLEEK